MSMLPMFRASVLAVAGLLSIAFAGSVGAQMPDPDLVVAAAPAAPSWDESSGYDAVEANRVTVASAPNVADITNQVPADVRWAPAAPSWDETSGYASVESNRAAAG
jgi:hypothetical protein